MKKEIILPFPGYEKNAKLSSKAAVDEISIRPGMSFRLGKPSNLYYEFIYASLHFERHTLADLKKMLKFRGLEVQAVSILKMKDGSKIASLSRSDGKAFSETMVRIFADVTKSLKSRELLFQTF